MNNKKEYLNEENFKKTSNRLSKIGIGLIF